MVYFLKGLCIIAALNTLATLARAFTFAAAGMAAARKMHKRLLAAVLTAPLSFFDANPAGQILNRFSSDTSIVDDSLPFILNILLANAVSLAGLLLVLLLGQPLLLLVIIPLAAAYRYLQLFYRCSARELRRLESTGLSPLYSLFGEAVAGAPTIRGAGAQRGFVKKQVLMAAVGNHRETESSSAGASSPSSVGIGWASHSSFRVHLLGLALAYCLPIVQLLNGLLTSSAETEQEMVAVERVTDYLETIQPEQQPDWQPQVGSSHNANSTDSELHEPLLLHHQQNGNEQLQWRMHQRQLMTAAAAAAGTAVAFVDVVMRYKPQRPPSLRGVTFKVYPGQKLGICGRTGAGKSSIFSALLRLRPIQSGLILVQNCDARQLALRDLRGRFGVVPQSPVLFSGSIRENLDPWGLATDEQLAAALQDSSHGGSTGVPGRSGSGVTVPEWWQEESSAMQEQHASAEQQPQHAQHAIQTRTLPGRPADDLAADAPRAVKVAAAAVDAARSLLSPVHHRSPVRRRTTGRQRAPQLVVLPDDLYEPPPLPMRPAQAVLNMQVGGVAGLQLSTGQAQLVCLARVLVRGARLVLLDEATGAVDPATAALINQVLHEQLDMAQTTNNPSSSSSSRSHPSTPPTIIQIAHELSAILDYDSVLVMAAGKVVEQGNPQHLLQQEGSAFKNLVAQASHGLKGTSSWDCSDNRLLQTYSMNDV
eukprot:gene3522-3792_t